MDKQYGRPQNGLLQGQRCINDKTALRMKTEEGADLLGRRKRFRKTFLAL
jgi:hypothetical protein